MKQVISLTIEDAISSSSVNSSNNETLEQQKLNQEILDALIFEAESFFNNNSEFKPTTLKPINIYYDEKNSEAVNLEETTFSVSSLSQWLIDKGHKNMANQLIEYQNTITNFYSHSSDTKEHNKSDVVKPYVKLNHWLTHTSLTIEEISFLFMGVEPDLYTSCSVEKSNLEEASKFISIRASLIKAVGINELKGEISTQDPQTKLIKTTIYDGSAEHKKPINPKITTIKISELYDWMKPKKELYGEFWNFIESSINSSKKNQTSHCIEQEAGGKHIAQENAIKSHLTNCGFNLLKIPRYDSGKPSEAKQSAKQELLKNKKLFGSNEVFEKAWKRLRKYKEIADSND